MSLAKKLIIILAIFCAGLAVTNVWVSTSYYMEVEKYVGFYAAAGFIAFTIIVYASKLLKKILGRHEEYYKPFSTAYEKHPDEDTDPNK